MTRRLLAKGIIGPYQSYNFDMVGVINISNPHNVSYKFEITETKKATYMRFEAVTDPRHKVVREEK